MKKFILPLLIFPSLLLSSNYYYEFDKKIYLKEKSSYKTSKQINTIKIFEDEKGNEIKSKNELIIICKDKTCEKDFSNLEYKKISSKFYLIKVNNNDFFNLAQELHKKESIKSARPNFIRQKERR